MPFDTFTYRNKQQARWYPEGAMKVRAKDGCSTAYVYAKGKRTVVLYYAGNSAKSAAHVSFGSRDEAAKYIRTAFDNLQKHRERVASGRKEGSAPHSLKAGDIITNSWGYDQTNVDWYRVVRCSSNYVWLQPVASQTGNTGFMSGNSAPRVNVSSSDPSTWSFDDLAEPIQRRKVSMYGDQPSVHFPHGSGSKWDGQAKYCSWYA